MYRSSLVDVRKINDIPPPGHIDYRYHMKTIWMIAFLGFGVWGWDWEFVGGVLWAVYGHSIQNAFAIAGWLLGFSLGTLHAMCLARVYSAQTIDKRT